MLLPARLCGFTEVSCFLLQDAQERLRALQDLGVGSLGLGDGSVERCSGGEPLSQTLVDSAQLLRQDADVVLQSILLFFLLLDLTVQLVPLGAQVLNT